MLKNRNLNTKVNDKDSFVTGFGRHDRVVAFCPDLDGLYCRVDHLWNLGSPSIGEVLTVAKKWNGMKGNWTIKSVTPWPCGKSTDYIFEKK